MANLQVLMSSPGANMQNQQQAPAAFSPSTAKRPRMDLVQKAMASFIVDHNYSEAGIVKKNAVKTNIPLKDYVKLISIPVFNSKPNACAYASCVPQLISELQSVRHEMDSSDLNIPLLYGLAFLGLSLKNWELAQNFKSFCSEFLSPEISGCSNETEVQRHFQRHPVVFSIEFWNQIQSFLSLKFSSGAILALLNGFLPQYTSSSLQSDSSEKIECKVVEESTPNVTKGNLRTHFYCVNNAFQGLASACLSDRYLACGFESSVIKLFAPGNRSLRLPHETPVVMHGHRGPVYGIRAIPLAKKDEPWKQGLAPISPSLIAERPDHYVIPEVLVSASADATVRLWKDGQDIAVYRGHSTPVWCLDNHGDQLIATGGMDSSVRLFDLERTYPIRIFHGHELDVDCIQFHPNGAYVASGSSDKTIRFWAIAEGRVVRLFHGHKGTVSAIAFSPDGKQMASAAEDRRIRIWDIGSSQCIKEFRGHTDTVLSLHYSPSGKKLVSCGMDSTLRVWYPTLPSPSPPAPGATPAPQEDILYTPATSHQPPLLLCRFITEEDVAYVGSSTQDG